MNQHPETVTVRALIWPGENPTCYVGLLPDVRGAIAQSESIEQALADLKEYAASLIRLAPHQYPALAGKHLVLVHDQEASARYEALLRQDEADCPPHDQ